VIFPTNWGHFGLAGADCALCRTQLPGPKPEIIRDRLLRNLPDAEFDGSLFKPLQKRIAAYFAGDKIDFAPEIPVNLAGLTPFQTAVLNACRQVRRGRTISYGQLAQNLGKPAAARAVGNALAKNPIPLIIPCHRILRANKNLGGFSAPGGIALKEKMLAHEQTRKR